MHKALLILLFLFQDFADKGDPPEASELQVVLGLLLNLLLGVAAILTIMAAGRIYINMNQGNHNGPKSITNLLFGILFALGTAAFIRTVFL